MCSFRRLSLSAAVTTMESVTRKVNVKNRGASVSAFAREHYLRRDLPCRSELCFENCDNDFNEGASLPKDVTHYLVGTVKGNLQGWTRWREPEKLLLICNLLNFLYISSN